MQNKIKQHMLRKNVDEFVADSHIIRVNNKRYI